MRYPILLCFALSLINSAMGQPPLTITDAGYFLTVIDEDGKPSLIQTTTIIDLRSTVPPLPENPRVDIPITPTTPSVNLELAKEIEVLVRSLNDPQASQAIAVVYSHIKGALSDNTLNTTNVWPALRAGTDKAINVTNGKDWSKFRSRVSELATIGMQQGKLDDNKELVNFLASTQHGLELAADGSESLTIDKLVSIAATTNAAIDAALGK